MPNTSTWLTPSRATTWRSDELSTARAGDTTREIADDPTSIVVMRGSTSLAAQTVRLLTPRAAGRESESAGGHAARADVVVLGDSTLNIQNGDRFLVGTQLYEVIYVPPAQDDRKEADAVQVQ